jgi:hypothetical protein
MPTAGLPFPAILIIGGHRTFAPVPGQGNCAYLVIPQYYTQTHIIFLNSVPAVMFVDKIPQDDSLIGLNLTIQVVLPDLQVLFPQCSNQTTWVMSHGLETAIVQ